jgi:hypothetical protein
LQEPAVTVGVNSIVDSLNTNVEKNETVLKSRKNKVARIDPYLGSFTDFF